jgi:hypothetical protein
MEHDKHAAKPQRRDSFEKGLDHKPDPPEEDLSRTTRAGVREGEPDEEGRFSEGVPFVHLARRGA